MTRKRLFAAAAASAATAAILLTWLVALGSSSRSQTPPIRTTGTPVALSSLSSSMQKVLAHSGSAQEVDLLHQAGGHSFYLIKRPDGVICFAVDDSTICPNPGEGPLLSKEPVVDVTLSKLVAGPGGRLVPGPVSASRGIAADGIASVALVTSGGHTVSAPVVDNTYSINGPVAGVKGMEALDSSGRVVWYRNM